MRALSNASFILALSILSSLSSKLVGDDGFANLSDIESALNPLQEVANHGGIRRSIDLNIAFALDSDQLLPEALNQLQVLGEALSADKLSGYAFQIIGHTDAQGDENYNQALSQRRAQSVARYLHKQHGIANSRMAILGKGETQLLDQLPPHSARHRRVEIALQTDSAPSKKNSGEAIKETRKETGDQISHEPSKEPSADQDGNLSIDW